MQKVSSRHLPSYRDTLKTLETTQGQLVECIHEYESSDSSVVRAHVIEQMEALCAMREDAGKILTQVSKANLARKLVQTRAKRVYDIVHLRPAA